MNGDKDNNKNKDEEDKIKKKKDNRMVLKAFSLVTQLGLQMACCVIAGFFFGRFLDNRLGTAPWLMLAFVCIGAGSAIKIIYDIAKDWK